jgi:hypothetical protein
LQANQIVPRVRGETPLKKEMVITSVDFNFTKLVYTSDLKSNANGGKFATVGYETDKNQVEFQLGNSPKDALRCAYEVELSSKEDTASGWQMKLRLSDEAKLFIQGLDDATIDAAEKNIASWFNKKNWGHEKVKGMHVSAIKESDYGDCLKLKVVKEGTKQTTVYVASWKNGKLTTPKRGTLDDVKQGSMVLPIITIKGGVYFMKSAFGTSLAAKSLLVFEEEHPSNTPNFSFHLGDVEMTDAEDEES